MSLLEEFGSDAVRYWAACGRPGTDTTFDLGQVRVGRRLAIKVLNVSKFVLGIALPAAGAEVTEPLDLAMLAGLDELVARATSAMDDFEYTAALEAVERFFWRFCDDYVELVKQRAYHESGGTGAESARLALRTALSMLLRLLAPFLPYVAEEAWSWWHDDSVHASPWPLPATAAQPRGADLLELASTVIGAVRKAKSDAKRSMRAPVEVLQVSADAAQLDAVAAISGDLRAAGNVAALRLLPSEASGLDIAVVLADD
jgi:valyl-tRNA synthetase